MHTHAQTSACGQRKKCPSQSVPIPIFTGLDIKPRWSKILPSGGLFLIWCKERDSLLLWWTRWKDELPGATSCNRYSPVEKVGLRMKDREKTGSLVVLQSPGWRPSFQTLLALAVFLPFPSLGPGVPKFLGLGQFEWDIFLLETTVLFKQTHQHLRKK